MLTRKYQRINWFYPRINSLFLALVQSNFDRKMIFFVAKKKNFNPLRRIKPLPYVRKDDKNTFSFGIKNWLSLVLLCPFEHFFRCNFRGDTMHIHRTLSPNPKHKIIIFVRVNYNPNLKNSLTHLDGNHSMHSSDKVLINFSRNKW